MNELFFFLAKWSILTFVPIAVFYSIIIFYNYHKLQYSIMKIGLDLLTFLLIAIFLLICVYWILTPLDPETPGIVIVMAVIPAVFISSIIVCCLTLWKVKNKTTK